MSPAAAVPSASLFTDRRMVAVLATLCCLLWGSAYPAIKNGYALFGIAPADVASQLVFAGYRFLFAGLVLCAFAACRGAAVLQPMRGHWRATAVLGLSQTTLQYFFFYVGLSHTTGVKGSIMNATGTFFSVLLAHFIYHNDRISHRKLLGCGLGLAGVMAVNFSGDLLQFEFTLLGEGFVVIAAFVLSAAAIYGKRLSQQLDPLLMTGWQLGIGGVALLAIGYGTGGHLSGFTVASTALLAYLVLLSSAAFALWSALLKVNRVSTVTAFNFLVPVFGALLSAAFLQESVLQWKNAVALVLVCYGIWLVTVQRPPSR
ncbi:DMT family transporter [Schlegelella sp. S2-27]|uniref:DMT family transporter n=1 Tax=Caldimonas mangrovi TaxID=2944811 RepID=A0ABT0YTW0_9BURK|nr:DMT family transporter [Caldimonas mangrovi]MCM5682185.1 DMT family transporter [Caldimonas mangrovi]